MEHVRKDGPERKDARRGGKKPYTPPELFVHGGVEEITEDLRRAGTKHAQVSGIV